VEEELSLERRCEELEEVGEEELEWLIPKLKSNLPRLLDQR